MTPLPLLLALLAAPGPEVARYAVVMKGKAIGALTVRTAAGEISTELGYRNNGRGPDLAERLAVAPDGTLARYRVTGRLELGGAVEESFAREGGRASWRGGGGDGEAQARGPAFYLPAVGTSEVNARLARAASARPGGRLALWPSGEVTAQRLREARLRAGGRERQVALYALSGIGFQPGYVWLSAGAAPRLFAEVDPVWPSVVEAGWEEALPELVRQQQEASAALLREQARRLRHPLAEPVLIRGARLFDAERARLLPPRDVYLAGGRIALVAEAGSPAQAPGTVIEAAGKVLLPGLVDMHAHLGEFEGPLHLAAGVTGVRDLANDNLFLAELMGRLERGEAVGPRVFPLGFIEGQSPYSSNLGFVVEDLAGVHRAIDWYAQRGFRQLKLYNSFRPEWVAEAVAHAHALGLRVGGHVPAFLRAEEAVAQGYDELHHVNQVLLNFLQEPGDDTRTTLRFTRVAERAGALDLSSAPVQGFLRLLRERGTVVDPTVATFEDDLTMRRGDPRPSLAAVMDHLPPAVQRALRVPGMEISEADAPRYRAAFAREVELVGVLHRAGIPLVAGTDSLPGFMLHRELELYVRAGIPPAEVLRIATWEAARRLGALERLGSVEAGKEADLLLVDGDPTADIAALRRVALVVQRGVAYHPAELYQAVGVRPFLPRMALGAAR